MRETKEQDMYFNRLNRANERQMHIFQKHFEEVMRPREEEHKIQNDKEDHTLNLMQAKLNQMAQIEESEKKHEQVDYGEILRKQIEEKNRINDMEKLRREREGRLMQIEREMYIQKEQAHK